MGNTCGSCSFDNRGSEFDMQRKEPLSAAAPSHNNPNVMKEENPNVMTNKVNLKPKEVYETKNGAAPQYDVESKENNFLGQYQAAEEKVVQEVQEVQEEKETLGNTLLYLSNHDP